MRGRLEACRLVNDKRFRRVEELPNDLYEVLMARGKIVMNIPTQLAYFVLQLAKLHMLKFFFEGLDHFVPRHSYEMLEMDTGKNEYYYR